jgi:hypothetical protein
VPFLFAEVPLSPPEPGRVPHLESRVPEKNYVFVWDGRRDCGYLLVIPAARLTGALKFEVSWAEE